MKWIKPYNLYNESLNSPNNDLNLVIFKFNMLFQPLGLNINNYEQLPAVTTIKLNLNFATQLKDFSAYSTNDMSLPVIRAIKIDEKYPIKHAYPLVNENNRLENIIFDFLIPNSTIETHIKVNNNIMYEYIMPDSVEEILRIIIEKITKVFKHFSDNLTVANDIDMPKPIYAPMFKYTTIAYCNYLLGESDILNLSTVPKELYRIFYDELSKYQDVFKVLNILKDTPLYNKFKEVGNPDKLLTATDMGDMGF